MKKSLLLLIAALITTAALAQNAASSPYLEAFYDPSAGTISYRQYGEITKDGLKLVDLKTKALDKYALKVNPGSIEMNSIEQEKANLDKLKQRIVAQREKMMQPMSPMQETQ